jgi:hypothetical protein
MFNLFKRKPKNEPSLNNNEKQAGSEPRNGVFDPRNPETYQFATNAPLVIDGVAIYEEYTNDDDTIKEPVTEQSFVQIVKMLLGIQKKIIAWEEAVKLVKPDFTFEGKEPNQGTPGYIERANEVCQSILKNPDARLTKKQEKDYIEDFIQDKIYECKQKITFNYGGYNFSEAQMEIVKGIPKERIIKIGEIISKGKLEHKRSYQIKQDLFHSLGFDGEFLVRLHDCSYKLEQRHMADYYHECEFDTEEEVFEYFNNSEYLKNHPKLKEIAVKDALECKIGKNEVSK